MSTELWGLREAATHLHMSAGLVKKLAKAGHIPVLKTPVEGTLTLTHRVDTGQKDTWGDAIFEDRKVAHPDTKFFHADAVRALDCEDLIAIAQGWRRDELGLEKTEAELFEEAEAAKAAGPQVVPADGEEG